MAVTRKALQSHGYNPDGNWDEFSNGVILNLSDGNAPTVYNDKKLGEFIRSERVESIDIRGKRYWAK